MNKKLIGQATIERCANDLYWSICFFDRDNNYTRLLWRGYNDKFWWEKWSVDSRTKQKIVGSRAYEIDFDNCNVYEIGAGKYWG